MKTAIVTVSSPTFVKGTQVLINSFSNRNLWFEGDFIVLDAGLSKQDKHALQSGDRGVKFELINRKLVAAVDDLVHRLPIYAGRRARFYSIDALRLNEYDRLLYCDSDMIFLQSIEELFQQDDDLLACGDGAFLNRAKRHRVTFEQCGDDDGFSNTFNAGFMMFGKRVLSGEFYQKLIDLMNADILDHVTTGHTDQVLFNHMFCGRQRLIDPMYNFLLENVRGEVTPELDHLNTIKVAHFNGPAKPWDPAASQESARRNLLYNSVQKQWIECYVDALKSMEQG